ncbi:hypothetical protein NDU88_002592 [Pleurodeles waltl]|uniref:Uncharacterized protein n=1 Tax=Pleurodeles waltl TaxID=8319 RepID=A0AAV7MRW8_PLEWA|nr:hypothetical protein NDU88_002592 [Pleurodeles waltl]
MRPPDFRGAAAKVRCRTGPGARRKGVARLGPLPPRLHRCWCAALPPHAGRGGGDPEDDGPPRNLCLKTTTTVQAKKHYPTRTK